MLIKRFFLKLKLLTRIEPFVALLSETSMVHVTVPPPCGGSMHKAAPMLGLGASEKEMKV